MVGIMTKMWRRHPTLSQSYEQLKQQHENEINMKGDTKDQLHKRIVFHKDIEVTHQEIMGVHTN
jgi:hypothetical protein